MPAAARWFALVCCALLLPGCPGKETKSGQGGRGGGPPRAVPVTIGIAAAKDVPVQIREIGNVEAYASVLVRSQIAGQLEKVHFREGQPVEAGDMLFTIDDRLFRAELLRTEANLARNAALAFFATREAARTSVLGNQGSVSKQEDEEGRSKAEAAAASVKADRAAVESAKLKLGYATVRSPIRGITGNLAVHPGNLIKENGDPPLVRILQIEPIYVSFQIPERNLPDIRKRMKTGKLRVEARWPDRNDPPSEGELVFVNNEVDRTAGVILLKAEFPNKDQRLWPGQFVDVVLDIDTRPNAVVVPSEAVQTGQQGEYVFVVNPDMTVQTRPVKTSLILADETVIEEGVKAGESVVTDGHMRLTRGAKVEVKTKTAETPEKRKKAS